LPQRFDRLPGTLHLLIVKALSLRMQHGYEVLLRVNQIAQGGLLVEQGAHYPTLYRPEIAGLISSEWGPSRTIETAMSAALHARVEEV
jgi:PadR family transcriptional regulator, regulatory protein PadR